MSTTTNFLWKNNITKTHLYNFDCLKPHIYIVKLGFTGVYIIFLILLKNHRLWVLLLYPPQTLFVGGILFSHPPVSRSVCPMCPSAMLVFVAPALARRCDIGVP